MAEFKDRLRELRKSVGLSQTKFGERVGVGLGVIRNLEDGLTSPSPMFLDLICRTYGCDRIWLETGDGEMFREMSRDEQIAAFVGKTLSDSGDDFAKQFLALLANLDDVGWQNLKAAAETIRDAQEKTEGK